MMNLTATFSRGLPTQKIGKVLYYQAEIDSTNNLAKQLAKAGEPEGSLVIAEKQTKGRGRWERSWASPAGVGLWFSLILRPPVAASQIAGITLLTTTVLAQVIYQETNLQVGCKWPNDLVYEGQKLGGILAEVKGKANGGIEYLILGIGLNVNQQNGDFPPELQEKATSLREICGEKFLRQELLRSFLTSFEPAYQAFLRGETASVLDYARQNSVTIGKLITIDQGFGRIASGKAVALEADGSIILETAAGIYQKIYAGEIPTS